MPNWCSNTLILEHDDPAMIKRAETAFTEGKFLEEFVPNPGIADDWYEFNINNWGTKWDVGTDLGGIHEVTENSIDLYFDSAWAPPVEAYNKLTEMGFRVDAMYHEPGVAFAGIYRDGVDVCYDLSGLGIEQVRAELPPELDQAFDIVEMMEDWESDNQDE